MEGKDDREDDLLAQDKHSSSPREDKETSGRRADAKHSGGDGDDGDRLSDAELEQLFYAVDFLSGTLLEDLMPGDDPPDDVLEGGPLAAKCWEYTFSVLGEFEAASIDAGVDSPARPSHVGARSTFVPRAELLPARMPGPRTIIGMRSEWS